MPQGLKKVLPDSEKNLKWKAEEEDDEYQLGSQGNDSGGDCDCPINHQFSPEKVDLLPELIQRSGAEWIRKSGHHDMLPRSVFTAEGHLPIDGGCSIAG